MFKLLNARWQVFRCGWPNQWNQGRILGSACVEWPSFVTSAPPPATHHQDSTIAQCLDSFLHLGLVPRLISASSYLYSLPSGHAGTDIWPAVWICPVSYETDKYWALACI